MNIRPFPLLGALGLLTVTTLGCASPYYADRGALFGGAAGAGLGAIVGDAVDEPLAGAAIGAMAGSLTGGAVGASLDEIEARNRAAIEAQLGRSVRSGSVTLDEVIAMTRAGVDDELIVNHIRIHGAADTLRAADIIRLKQNGVSPQVIRVMQQPPEPKAVVREVSPAPPVVVEEHYYEPPPPFWPGPRPWHRRYHHHHPHSSVQWGLSISAGD